MNVIHRWSGVAGEAGWGEGTLGRVMQNDKRAAMQTGRGETAEMKGKI
jgi:hypothetical protein